MWQAEIAEQSSENYYYKISGKNCEKQGLFASLIQVFIVISGSDLGVMPFKRPKRSRLTEKMKTNRLNFTQTHKHWTKVMWSDESPILLLFQIDRMIEYRLENPMRSNTVFKSISCQNSRMGDDVPSNTVS